MLRLPCRRLFIDEQPQSHGAIGSIDQCQTRIRQTPRQEERDKTKTKIKLKIGPAAAAAAAAEAHASKSHE
jgi:hypothetical protein